MLLDERTVPLPQHFSLFMPNGMRFYPSVVIRIYLGPRDAGQHYQAWCRATVPAPPFVPGFDPLETVRAFGYDTNACHDPRRLAEDGTAFVVRSDLQMDLDWYYHEHGEHGNLGPDARGMSIQREMLQVVKRMAWLAMDTIHDDPRITEFHDEAEGAIDERRGFELDRAIPGARTGRRYPLRLQTLAQGGSRKITITIPIPPEMKQNEDITYNDSKLAYLILRVKEGPVIDIKEFYNDFGPGGGMGTSDQQEAMRGIGSIMMRAALDVMQRVGYVRTEDLPSAETQLLAYVDGDDETRTRFSYEKAYGMMPDPYAKTVNFMAPKVRAWWGGDQRWTDEESDNLGEPMIGFGRGLIAGTARAGVTLRVNGPTGRYRPYPWIPWVEPKDPVPVGRYYGSRSRERWTMPPVKRGMPPEFRTVTADGKPLVLPGFRL